MQRLLGEREGVQGVAADRTMRIELGRLDQRQEIARDEQQDDDLRKGACTSPMEKVANGNDKLHNKVLREASRPYLHLTSKNSYTSILYRKAKAHRKDLLPHSPAEEVKTDSS
jgi:hypothetical protein